MYQSYVLAVETSVFIICDYSMQSICQSGLKRVSIVCVKSGNATLHKSTVIQVISVYQLLNE